MSVAQELLSSGLDYYANSMLYGIAKQNIMKLQRA